MLQFAGILEQRFDRNVVDDVLGFRFGDPGQQIRLALIRIDQYILDDVEQIDRQTFRIGTGRIDLAHPADDFGDLLVVYLQIKGNFLSDGCQTKDVFDIFKLQTIRIIGETLFQQGEGITHSAFRHAGEFFSCLFIVWNLFFVEDIHHSLFDLIKGDLGEVVSLTSGKYRRDDFLRIGRRQDKDDMSRRFFKCLQ